MIPFPFKKTIKRFLLAIVITPIILAAFAFFFPQQILCIESGAAKADALIVLGGGNSHERAVRAAELYKEHVGGRIFVSGLGDTEINQRALMEAGVPESAIQLESNSRNTEENATFTVKQLRARKIKSAIIVTSWYHSRRALRTFQHCAPEIKFYSRPSYAGFRRATWSHQLEKRIYLEYAKLAGYWVRYGVCPF